ncbi:hypothetical protein Vafri_21113 [Volvox africanus]|uniref:Nop domain-containing protein n=1 Tax=Volvox africanus TaxID=51714 RepID=A0A8J4FBE9_9CHLO|nr:hypothetical protein Vafri_21113 [Volvox africanus]
MLDGASLLTEMLAAGCVPCKIGSCTSGIPSPTTSCPPTLAQILHAMYAHSVYYPPADLGLSPMFVHRFHDAAEHLLVQPLPQGPPEFRRKLWLPSALRQFIPGPALFSLLRCATLQCTLPPGIIHTPPLHWVKSPTVHQLFCNYSNYARSLSHENLRNILNAPCRCSSPTTPPSCLHPHTGHIMSTSPFLLLPEPLHFFWTAGAHYRCHRPPPPLHDLFADISIYLTRHARHQEHLRGLPAGSFGSWANCLLSLLQQFLTQHPRPTHFSWPILQTTIFGTYAKPSRGVWSRLLIKVLLPFNSSALNSTFNPAYTTSSTLLSNPHIHILPPIHIHLHFFPNSPTSYVLLNQRHFLQGSHISLVFYFLRFFPVLCLHAHILFPSFLHVPALLPAIAPGKPLDDEALSRVLAGCEMAVKLDEDKRTVLQFVESKMNEVAPNLSAVVGTEIAAKLMGVAGGLLALSRMPSCNIQSLGAKRKALAGFSATTAQPHQGFISSCPILAQTPPSLRSKAARLIAAKGTLLARKDAYGEDPTGAYGAEMRAEVLRKIEKWQEPPPAKQVKPLPVPDAEVKKRRGGRRLRKMKERYGLTDMRKAANRMMFNKAEEEWVDGDDVIGLGVLGKEGSGRLRIVASQQKQKLSAKAQKKFKARMYGSSGATSGLSSSLAFTPVQGIELENPSARFGVDLDTKDGTQSYFSQFGGFRSVKK